MQVFDVFISYSRKDESRARLFRDLLEDEGWAVWLDEQIPVGNVWSEELEKALDIAKGVIVLWTEDACRSEWVRREARYAFDQDKLFGLKLDECQIPEPFRGVEAALLTKWQEAMDHPEWTHFLRSLAARVVPSRKELLRPGFDSRFLGEDRRVPWPAVFGTARQIHYLHFSVVANPARRLAWYVAYNVDMRRRGDLGERAMKLTEDPHIATQFQPSDRHFRGSGYDRGHLACRRSLGWGEERIPGVAGRQAFYLTNTAPQHPEVNRVSYLSVERWEQEASARLGPLVVLCGPVLDDDDPTFRDEEVGDDEFVAHATFRIPRAFWKIVVALDEQRRLVSRAFYFENPIPDPDAARLRLSRNVASYTVPIDQLQARLPSIELPKEITSAGLMPLR